MKGGENPENQFPEHSECFKEHLEKLEEYQPLGTNEQAVVRSHLYQLVCENVCQGSLLSPKCPCGMYEIAAAELMAEYHWERAGKYDQI